jgi:hypothetical protein
MSEHYIPNDQFPEGIDEYVAWVDIMGSRNAFQKSLKTATTYVLKLNKIFDSVIRQEAHGCSGYYPIIDGLYFTHGDKDLFLKIMQKSFVAVANEFMEQSDPAYRFMIRGGISYGTVIHGKNIDVNRKHLDVDKRVIKSLLFGKPLVDCCAIEKNSAPFSISIYGEAVQRFNNNGKIFKWFRNNDQLDMERFICAVDQYYQWFKGNEHWNEYPKEKRDTHLKKFNEMVSGID